MIRTALEHRYKVVEGLTNVQMVDEFGTPVITLPYFKPEHVKNLAKINSIAYYANKCPDSLGLLKASALQIGGHVL